MRRYLAAAFLLLLIFLYWPFRSSKTSNLNAVDLNGNGIWDEFEPFIERRGKTELERSTLTVFFRLIQRELSDPNLGTAIKQGTISEYDRPLVECLYALERQDPQFPSFTELEDTAVNSIGRIKAYIKFNGKLSGMMSSLWDEKVEGDACLAVQRLLK